MHFGKFNMQFGNLSKNKTDASLASVYLIFNPLSISSTRFKNSDIGTL